LNFPNFLGSQLGGGAENPGTETLTLNISNPGEALACCLSQVSTFSAAPIQSEWLHEWRVDGRQESKQRKQLTRVVN
jgi:hypothetical protein